MKYNGPHIRQPGMYDVNQACEECCIQEWGPSMTQQSQAEDADINTIVKRFGLTGKLPENVRTPTYGDFTEVTDYKTAMDAIAQANSSFMQMPAAIRARFENDPQQFVEYCSDPSNIEDLRGMGLALPKPPETPQRAPAGTTNPEPAPGGKPPGDGQKA